jgi:threonine/homoserine/homoserine lactone efflux protein
VSGSVVFIFIMSIALLWAKPGPGQALKVTTALNSGFLPAISIAIGITIICNFYLLIAIFGSNLITKFFTDISIFFKVFGAIYLFYMAYKVFKNRNSKTEKKIPNRKDLIRNVGIGFLMALSNPIAIFYFVGILPGLIDISQLLWTEILLLIFIMNVTGLFVDVLIIILSSQFKTAFESDLAKKSINTIIGLGFVLIGLYLLYTAYIGKNFSYSLI